MTKINLTPLQAGVFYYQDEVYSAMEAYAKECLAELEKELPSDKEIKT